jgi:hypothetical protein
MGESALSIYPDFSEISEDQTFRHSCSTFGGNSGGPMLVEGTRIVVGVPDEYSESSSPDSPLDERKTIQGVRVNAFVKDFRTQIESLGISLVTPRGKFPGKLNYFSNGLFQDQNGLQVEVSESAYYSQSTLRSLKLSGYKNKILNGDYSCFKAQGCIQEEGELGVIFLDQDRLVVRRKKSAENLLILNRLSIN